MAEAFDPAKVSLLFSVRISFSSFLLQNQSIVRDPVIVDPGEQLQCPEISTGGSRVVERHKTGRLAGAFCCCGVLGLSSAYIHRQP